MRVRHIRASARQVSSRQGWPSGNMQVSLRCAAGPPHLQGAQGVALLGGGCDHDRPDGRRQLLRPNLVSCTTNASGMLRHASREQPAVRMSYSMSCVLIEYGGQGIGIEAGLQRACAA